MHVSTYEPVRIGGNVTAASDSFMRPVMTVMRVVLYAGSLFVFLAGIQTFILTEETGRFFAWEIGIPLTAAFLGAGYFSSAVLGVLIARERFWANARTTIPAVWSFTVLTLIATLLHLEPFRMDTIYGWLWLIIYVVQPVALTVAWIMQVRQPGRDPERAPLPRWLRLIAVAQGAIFTVLGVGLFLTPDIVDRFWPWPLTPLTARASAAWLIALGILLLHLTLENDWRRARDPLTGYLVWAVLVLLACARYPDPVDWDAARSWLFLAFVLTSVATAACGVYRTWAATDLSPRPAQPSIS